MSQRKVGVQTRSRGLWAIGLIELSNGKYTCTTIMPSKKNVFGNWMENWMCRNYRRVNRKTKLDCYAMLMPKEIFDVVGFF